MKRHAIISLLLLIPAPSIGVLFGMVLFPDTSFGQGVFIFSKFWLLALPAIWFFLIERGRPSRVHTVPGGYIAGWLSGLLISAFVIGAAWLLGDRLIDREFFREMIAGVGLDQKPLYLAGAAYWILVNSVLEEYVWRWFTVRQCSKLFHPTGAIIASGVGFTIHHFIAMQVYFSPLTAALCSLFILIGGVWWSWMFVRYKTIWPGWLSHALVDIAVFAVGYFWLFG